MSIPAYPDYRDSGVSWLGMVPSHWETLPMKAVCELNPSKAEIRHLSTDTELSFLPMEAISEDGALDLSRTRIISEVSTGYSFFANGDVVFAKVTPCFENGKGALMRDLIAGYGFGTTELTVLRPRRQQDDRFLRWLTASRLFRDPATGEMQGAGGLKRVPDAFVSSFKVPWPSEDERKIISAFLDRETAKIDDLVAEQERLVALLKEKRQAVISHTVTKGLNPNAPMRDSGVEWLGEIPSHWTVTRLSNLYREAVREGSDDLPILSVSIHHGVSDSEIPDEEMDRMVARSEDRSKYKRVQPNDLVYNMMRAWQGGFGTVRAHGQVSPAYVVAEPVSNLKSEFVEAVLRTPNAVEEMRRHSRGVTDFRLRLYWDQFKNLKIGVPPADEIDEILARIHALVQQYDSLASVAQEAIGLLQERRAALISAAVTGKIDVRGAISPTNVVSIETARTGAVQPSIRACVGAMSIRALGSMGRMAVMKGGYLAEGYAGVSELAGTYQRDAAGPFCRAVIDGMERDAAQAFDIKAVDPNKDGERVTYRLPSNFALPAHDLPSLIGEDRAKRLAALFDLLKDLNRDGVEAIATLFAVWNDLLACGKSADEDAIIRGVLEDWHPEKAQKFNRETLVHWLAWMRRNQLVPDGTAPRTDHQGSLFQ